MTDMFLAIAHWTLVTSATYGSLKMAGSYFESKGGKYANLAPQVSLETLLTHLLHASSLTTKAQFCTWFLTFVSASYQGKSLEVALELLKELQAIPEDATATKAMEVQAGENAAYDSEAYSWHIQRVYRMKRAPLEDCELYMDDAWYCARHPRPIKPPGYDEYCMHKLDPRSDLEVDVAAECKSFMAKHPKGSFTLPAGYGMECQASWDEVRDTFGVGIDCFKAVRYAPLYKHARRLIAAMVAGTFLNDRIATDYKWFHKRLFADVDAKHGLDCVDLFDEVLDLTKAVFDTATHCIQGNSLRPLLGRGREAYAMDVEHAYLSSHHEYYMIGSLESVTEASGALCTNEAYVGRVEAHLISLKRHHAGSRDAERVVLTRRLTEAMKWDAEVKDSLSRASLRMEPFGVLIYGPTAQGKTTKGMQIMSHLLQGNGYPHGEKSVAQVDSSAKYMDCVYNSTMGIFMDDVANTQPQFQLMDQLALFIQTKNTSNVPVNKAGVEEKGKVFHNSKIVVVSTNTKDLNSKITSNEPSAIMRRFDLALRMRVKTDYSYTMDHSTTVGLHGKETLPMLDPSKMHDGVYTRAQLFDVMKWVPDARTQANPTDTGDWHVVRHNGRVMKDLEYDEMMLYAQERSAAHFANQRRMLAAFREDTKLTLCPHGAVPAPMCGLCLGLPPPVPIMDTDLQLESRIDNNLHVQAGDFITSLYFPEADEMQAGGEPISPWTASPDIWAVPPPTPPAPPEMKLPWWVMCRLKCAAWWHTATVAPEAPDVPKVIGWIKACSHGQFDLEKLAFTHFDGVMMVLLSVAPCAATVCSSFLALVGFGWFMTSFAWFSVFAYTGITLSRNARGWVAARVAGATFEELKKRSLDMAKASFTVLATFIGVLAVMQGLRKAANYVLSSDDKPVSPVSRETPPLCTVKKVDLNVQGGTLSTPGAAVAKPDPVFKKNSWEGRDVALWYRTEGSVRNMTEEQIYSKAEKQMYVMTIVYVNGATVASNCIIVATNYLLAPVHNFVRPDGSWSDIKDVKLQSTTESRGPVFHVKVSPRQMYRLPGDAMLVQINAGGTMPDLMDLFVDELPVGPFPAVELYRSAEDCNVKRQRYVASPELVTCATHNMVYKGVSYVREQPTFKGLCGAAVMTAARFPAIVGFHTMGNGVQGVGCCILKSDIQLGIAELRGTAILSGPVVTQNTTDLFVPMGMENAAVLGDLSSRSVMREVIPGTEFLPVGTLLNYKQVRPTSRLDVSPLSAIVEEECGEVRAHEPPRTIGKATVEVLKLHEMHGRRTLNPEDMRLALEDQYQELRAAVISLNFQEYLRPLTIDEATSGVADCHSVKAINRSTAAGFPYVGNKMPFVLPNPRDGLPDAFELTPETKEEVERVLDKMGRLERCNFVFKASHKDEPVKLGKMKTRVFEGSPLVLTIVTRMLFLPLIRLFLLARLMTGSSVGIDATSMEWHALYKHMQEFNGERAVIGDWVHFDTSQAYLEMMAIFGIWIRVCVEFGCYAEEEINAMWVIAEETSRHFALMRGDIGVTEGTTPSGGVLTVYVNNGIGEVRLKGGFYSLAREAGPQEHVPLWDHTSLKVSTGGLPVVVNGRAGLEPLLPNLHGLFADYVRGAYYGDDFMQAARESVLGWYNQKTLYTYFEKEGLQLTDASKKAFEHETTLWSEVTFLKRGFRYDEDTGCYMAPLEISSIYKSLHVWPTKLVWSKEVHAAQILSGCFRELLQHGREAYNSRMPPLLRAAERFQCVPYLQAPVLDYDTMIGVWFGRELGRVGAILAVPPSE